MELDIMNDDAFSLSSLTAAVNEQPVIPSQIQNSGLFIEKLENTTTFVVEKLAGKSALVGYSPRGGAGETRGKDVRKRFAFEIPHIQLDDSIMADEVQNVRAFGTENELETVQNKVMERIAKHLRDIDMTIEHQRAGAMRGRVLDKDGNLIVNMFSAFEYAANPIISMGLDTDSTNIQKKSEEVGYEMEDKLEGDVYASMWALCGREFWIKLINHPYVIEAYKAAANQAALLGKQADKFQLGPIVYERAKISPSATAAASMGGGFVEANKAVLVPVGVPDMFMTVFSPADYLETVNTTAFPRYVNSFPKKNNKGWDLEVQSNPLSICTRPQGLFELTI